MKYLTLIACSGLIAACTAQQFHGTGDPIGTHEGKTLYKSTCTVDLTAVGKKPMLGNRDKPASAYFTCEPQARATCESGYKVVQVIPGARSMTTSYFQNGPYTTRRTYPIQDMAITYTCTA